MYFGCYVLSVLMAVTVGNNHSLPHSGQEPYLARYKVSKKRGACKS